MCNPYVRQIETRGSIGVQVSVDYDGHQEGSELRLFDGSAWKALKRDNFGVSEKHFANTAKLIPGSQSAYQFVSVSVASKRKFDHLGFTHTAESELVRHDMFSSL
jgi:hypothetical protein